MRRLRLAGRLASLAAAVLLLLPLWPSAALVPPALSPFVAVCGAVAARAVAAATLLGLPVLVLAILLRRGFCRYACPVGLLLEGVGRLRPRAWRKPVRLPPVGQWVVWLTLGGALVGYPLLLWLDPLALFAGFFSVGREPLGSAASLAALGLPALLVLGLVLPGAWCRSLCPLGAVQEMLSSRHPHPSPLPEGEGTRAGAPPQRLARRAVLATGLGAAWAAATITLRRGATAPIRPPGAADESRFPGLCVRCGNCVRACPPRILSPDLGGHGLAGLLTPVVSFDRHHCRVDCRACTLVCPSGALARLSPDAKQHAVMGIARVDADLCVVSREQRDCALCQQACSLDAVRIVFDEASYRSFIHVDPAKCTGCGACQVACFTEPKKAILVHPL